MRIPLFSLLIVISLSSFSQADYFPDYRRKVENVLKVREKQLRADLTTFTIAGIEESVGKIPLRKIPFTSFSTNHMSFEGDKIKATVTTGYFDTTGHKLKRFGKNMIKIDNKPFYGSYGKLPERNIKSVTVILDKDTVAIPPEAYNDLYNLYFTYTDKKGAERSTNGVYLSPDAHTIYLYMLNKDVSGSYEVTWVITDKKYIRRVLDYDIL
jgi:hypothetical protein